MILRGQLPIFARDQVALGRRFGSLRVSKGHHCRGFNRQSAIERDGPPTPGSELGWSLSQRPEARPRLDCWLIGCFARGQHWRGSMAVRLRARVLTSSREASREEQSGFRSRAPYPVRPHDKGSRGKQLTYPLCE